MAGMEKLSSNLENRIVRYDEAVDPEQLTAHPLNFRRHPIVQRKALRASIEGHGWVAPVIATVDGTVIDGHARVEEALSSGVTVPVVYVDMDEDEAGSMILRLDPIAAMATHDSDVLSELLSDEEWTDQEDTLRDVLDELAATPTDIGIGDTPSGADDVPESVEAVSQPGDVWLLRSEHGMVHRVICGDSTDPDRWNDLLQNTEVDAVVTDPPYGVDYGGTVEFRRTMGKSQRATDNSYVANDGTQEAIALWPLVFPHVRSAMKRKGSAYYCWAPGGAQQTDMGLALRESGLEPHGTVIWVKSSFSFSRAEHKYQHEPCFYGWRTDGTHKWCGPNNETSVWEYDRPHKSPEHPTMKPVDLIRRCVVNISASGDIVLDPFLGSGTTLIACELEQRTCYGIELSPAYVDIICARWQGLTGIMPEHADTGEVHDFIGNP